MIKAQLEVPEKAPTPPPTTPPRGKNKKGSSSKNSVPQSIRSTAKSNVSQKPVKAKSEIIKEVQPQVKVESKQVSFKATSENVPQDSADPNSVDIDPDRLMDSGRLSNEAGVLDGASSGLSDDVPVVEAGEF